MYKVFVNELPLFLTDQIPSDQSKKVFSIDRDSIFNAIEGLQKKRFKEAYIYHANIEELMNIFCQYIPRVVAAGGKVKNEEGKILFIYRNDKWDLPKGKLDKGETIEEAAIREVEEETRVNGLVIESFLAKTYHVFKRGGVLKLKETYWYNMTTSFNGKLKPQLNEGITKVKWKGPRKTRKALKNSYNNIKILFEENNFTSKENSEPQNF